MPKNTLSFLSVIFIFVMTITISAAVPVSASENKDKTTKNKASPWSVNCSNDGKGLVCQLTQRIVLRKTKQLLIAVTIKKTGAEKSMLVHLPHGLYLPAGIKFQVDEKKHSSHPIQTCDLKGCYAGLPLEEAKIKLLKNGKKLNIVFQNLKKKNVKVPLALHGFDAAYQKL